MGFPNPPSPLNEEEKDTLVLELEEIIILFSRMFDIRRLTLSLIPGGDRLRFLARCIWLSLRVLALVEFATISKLRHDSALSAAFVRFLTRVLGARGGESAGGEGGLAKAKEALQEAKAAMKEGKEAKKLADQARADLSRFAVANGLFIPR